MIKQSNVIVFYRYKMQYGESNMNIIELSLVNQNVDIFMC